MMRKIMLDGKHDDSYCGRMGRLSLNKRVQILELLCEGMSMRAVSRLTGTSINTVSKMLIDAGKVCAAFHDENVRDVAASRVQCDEIWSFTYAKQKNVAKAKAAPDKSGDTWTWTALDADTKLLISYLVGGRDAEYANAFMEDVASRLVNRVQLTTDGHGPYLEAVEGAFGIDIDFAQLVKMYGSVKTAKGKSLTDRFTGAKKATVTGKPDSKHISTVFVERQNLTMRMHMRRFTRKTNGFSKKFENHFYMIALYTVYYNFCKIHQTLRITPAMEAGLSKTVRDFEWIVGLIDARAPKLGRPAGSKNKKPQSNGRLR